MSVNSYRIVLNSEHEIYLKEQRNFKPIQKRLYVNGINKQYRQYKNYLPSSCKSVLSIGCGLAVPDLPLYEHYDQSDDIKFYLFDRTQLDEKILHGYNQQSSFFNDLDLAKEIFVDYGVKEENIFLVHANNKNLKKLSKMDIITSFLSWGFHFPINVYLENIIELMHKNTILIIDIRKNTGDFEILQKNFDINIINQGSRTYRLICKLK
jgi:hypothetical protein